MEAYTAYVKFTILAFTCRSMRKLVKEAGLWANNQTWILIKTKHGC